MEFRDGKLRILAEKFKLLVTCTVPALDVRVCTGTIDHFKMEATQNQFLSTQD